MKAAGFIIVDPSPLHKRKVILDLWRVGDWGKEGKCPPSQHPLSDKKKNTGKMSLGERVRTRTSSTKHTQDKKRN